MEDEVHIWWLLYEQTHPLVLWAFGLFGSLLVIINGLLLHIWRKHVKENEEARKEHEHFATYKQLIACEKSLDDKIELLHEDIKQTHKDVRVVTDFVLDIKKRRGTRT